MINVFYNPKQSVNSNSFSPSSSKPKLVVQEWLQRFPDRVGIQDFQPTTMEKLIQVHDSDYVRGVFGGRRINGFGNTDDKVAHSLLYTTGSMLAAAEHALKEGIAVSPTSGFHHACYTGGGGFCTFNGLMLTAVELHNRGLAQRIGILDCDQHYGNGTDDIIGELKIKYITHYSAGDDFFDRKDAHNFLALLIRKMDILRNCDIILYQAGADPHINDPLGGFLTDKQLAQRDHIVFFLAKKMGIPVAWNLAGGYQDPIQKVLNIHNATMRECLNVYASAIN